MSLTILPDLVQGTDEWLAARCGIVTASEVGHLLTATLKVADNLTSRGLTAALTAERITGVGDPSFISDDMWRGMEDEPWAREVYAEHLAPVAEVGLMFRDFDGFRLGYSPDGLVGDDGLIEVKSRTQKRHMLTILTDRVPAENMAQLQCGLLVSGRAWIDYVSYCGGMHLWTKRVTPDPTWFAAITLATETCEANIGTMRRAYLDATADMPPTERVDRDAGFEF